MTQKNMNVVVTGANRGLGLGFVKEYLKKEANVFAGCREISPELQDLQKKYSQLSVIQMKVTDPQSIKKAFDEIGQKCDSIDILINNAGRMGKNHAEIAAFDDFEDATETLQTNILGPMWVAKHAIPLLKHAHQPKIIQITSGLGSIADNNSGDYYVYRISKAGLNMLNKNLAIEFRSSEITCVAICPGWVKTDMGGQEAPLSIDQSVKAMTNTIDLLTIENTGSYIQRHGEKYPY